MTRETVGKIVTDLLTKDKSSYNAVDIQQEMHKGYIDELQWCIRHAQNKISCREECDWCMAHRDSKQHCKSDCVKKCKRTEAIHGDIFVEVITKKEPLMPNVLRNYFVAKKACPTPTWDQSVFHFNHKSEDLVYLWTVPDRTNAKYMAKNKLHVPPELQQLLKFVLEFEDGTLEKKAMQLNGEMVNGEVKISPIIITQ